MSNPIRILLADAHPASQLVLTQFLLNHRDYALLPTVCDGLETLTLIQGSAPDVILLDIALSSMDGLWVARQLSPAQRGRVILHSAHYNHHTIAQAMDLGIPYFFQKPATQAALLSAIDAIAKKNQGISLPNPT